VLVLLVEEEDVPSSSWIDSNESAKVEKLALLLLLLLLLLSLQTKERVVGETVNFESDKRRERRYRPNDVVVGFV
jgi:hypothetical protein